MRSLTPSSIPWKRVPAASLWQTAATEEAWGLIEVPRISVRAFVAEGVGSKTLRVAPRLVYPQVTPCRPVGGRFPSPRRPLENLLLAALPADVQRRLLPGLEVVHLAEGETLYESGDELRYIYFPTDSIVSLACATADGQTTAQKNLFLFRLRFRSE